VKVFAVWEPILEVDWFPPTRFAMGRLWDHRASQFWDKHRLVATRMAHDAREPQPEPNCCERDGNLWDLAAVYPPGAVWGQTLPAATVFNGPVVEVRARIAEVLDAPHSGLTSVTLLATDRGVPADWTWLFTDNTCRPAPPPTW
jgi:hypothetical protein